jgi:hypothetical protein
VNPWRIERRTFARRLGASLRRLFGPFGLADAFWTLLIVVAVLAVFAATVVAGATR